MKIFAACILGFLSPLAGIQHAAATTFPDSLDIQGTNLNLGVANPNSVPVTPGVSLQYNNVEGGVSFSAWQAHQNSHEWRFTHASKDGASNRLVMKLGADHKLLLYANLADNPTPAITLDPAGVSSIEGSLTLGGTSNTMPAQTNATDISILNIGMANARYVKLGINNIGDTASFAAGQNATAAQSSVAIGNGAQARGYNSIAIGGRPGALSLAPAPYSVAIGAGAQATEEGAVAIGAGNASGGHSFAAGDSTASGAYATAGGSSLAAEEGATAFGYSSAPGAMSIASGSSSASSPHSAALGNGTAANYGASAFGYSTASGEGSTASGFSIASGAFATAFGYNTQANGYAQFVIGQFSKVGSNESPESWIETDSLFVVGNGTGPASRSNALVVKKNGDATFKGVIRTTAPAGDISMFEETP